MSAAADRVRKLLRRGILVWREEGNVRVRAPRGAITADDTGQLRSEKEQVLAYLSRCGLVHPDMTLAQALRRTGALPLSFAQERLWFLDRMGLSGPAYNIAFGLDLKGPLAVEALEQAINVLVDRHESLRTHFVADGDEVFQVIDAPGTHRGQRVDLSRLGDAERDAALARRMQSEIEAPLDLARGPLFRTTLVKLQPERHALLITVHHVVMDGWSLDLFQAELSQVYSAFLRGQPSPLPPLDFHYADYAVAQRLSLQGAALDGEIGYWKQRLADAPALLELPTDRPRPATPSFRGATFPFEVASHLRPALEALLHREGITLFMLGLATLDVLLWRLSGQRNIVVGTPIAGRTAGQDEQLIGFFANTLAMHVEIDGRRSVREHLQQVRGIALDAYSHQELPFERLVQALQPERSLSYQPIFQVMLTAQGNGSAAHASGSSLEGLEVDALRGERKTAKFDLMLELAHTPAGLFGLFEYASDLFDAATIERFAKYFERLLEQIVTQPDLPLSALQLLDADEISALVGERNATARNVPFRSPAEVIAAQEGDRTALVCDGQALSYRQLNDRAHRLAQRLVAEGVGPESIVGVHLPRSIELIISLVAVIRCGATYLPLDPGYPEDRLGFMVEDSSPVCIIGSGRLATGRWGATPVIAFEAAEVVVQNDDSLADPILPPTLPCRLLPGQLAYVLYTSGSTGRPKGVAMPWAALVNLLAWHDSEVSDAGAVRVSQFTAISFDVSLQEILSTLTSGRTLYIPPDEVRRDAAQFVRWLSENRINELFAPTLVIEALSEAAQESALDLPGLTGVNQAGEALRNSLGLRRLAGVHSGRSIRNHYGPTETHVATAHTLPADPQDWPTPVPIGRPIWNTQVYVLDESLQPAPCGVAGELYVAGQCLARGYLKRPRLTAAGFVACPFGEPGSLMYRTGDLVRWRADGSLEYLARSDQQLKIRGFRIEPGEIEAALSAFPGVRQAAVVAQPDASGRAQLVAYVAAPAAAGFDPVQAQRALAKALPDYMVPSRMIVLEHLPLTPNGKLDRRALPVPGTSATERRQPRTPQEAALAALFAEVLQLDRVGIDEDFFQLGGHSLLATRLVGRIRSRLGIELPIRALFEAPTVAQLAGRLQDTPRPRPALRPMPRPEAIPLSFPQQRMWFLHQLEGPSATYNLPLAIRLEGQLDVAALESALADVVARHEALRTRFTESGGKVLQTVLDPHLARPPLTCVTVAPEELERAVAKAAAYPIDLASELPLRASLFQVTESLQVMLLLLHHIAGDGGSFAPLINDLSVAYGARRKGEEPRFSPLPVQYADYSLWQRQWLGDESDSGSVLASQVTYWKQALADLPALLPLPTDHPRPAVASHRGSFIALRIPAPVHEALLRLAQAEQASLFMVLQAAVALLLSKLGAGDDIPLGTPVAGRTDDALHDLVGLFLNTLVLRTDTRGNPAFRELLARVKAVNLAAYSNQDLPFERLVEILNPPRSLSHAPLFQVSLLLQNNTEPSFALEGLAASPQPFELDAAKFDLTFNFAENQRADRKADGIDCMIGYASDLFDRSTIDQMGARLLRLFGIVVARPDRPVGGFDLLDDEERERLLQGWNATRHPVPDRSLDGLIEDRVALAPEAIALRSDGRQLSFRELNAQANRLARALLAHDAGSESIVAIALPRSIEAIIAVLAVLKTGAAYVPIDPDYPAERIRFMLEDAHPACLITTQALNARLQPPCPSLMLDCVDLQQQLQSLADHNLDPPELARPRNPLNPAYIIYTSGSTGQPKGVAVTQAGIVNHLSRSTAEYYAGPEGGSPLILSISFDGALTALFGPLLAGQPLTLLPPREELPTLVEGPQPAPYAVVKMTPSHLRLMNPLIDAHGATVATHTLMLGGEALRAGDLHPWQSRKPDLRIVNQYGPTEAAVGCCTWETTAALPTGNDGLRLPIGRPIWNTRVYVLDRCLQPVAVGVPGELYVAGTGLARGYLGRSGLTASRFIAHPFGRPGERLYRTGDQVRWGADGNLHYLGRTDHQIKHRGFRIEPSEIEAQLCTLEGVAEAVVRLRTDAQGREQLVAWVVATGGTDPGPARLRQQLAGRMPDYLVPTWIVTVDALPQTPSGKLDAAALPAPVIAPTGRSAPRTALETSLVELYAEVLGIPSPGIQDGFFDLGGDSIDSIRLVSLARKRGLLLKARDLFLHQTIAELAAVVRTIEGTSPDQDEEGGALKPTPMLAQWLELGAATQGYFQVMSLPLPSGCPDDRVIPALQWLLDRHEALRLKIAPGPGGIDSRLTVVPRGSINAASMLRTIALSPVDRFARQPRIDQACREAAKRLDDAAGIVVQAVHCQLGEPSGDLLLLVMSFSALDAASRPILAEEFAEVLSAIDRNDAVAAPPVDSAFRRWTRRLAEEAHRPGRRSELGYWQQHLAEPDPLLSFRAHDGSREIDRSGTAFSVRLPAPLTNELLSKATAALHLRLHELLQIGLTLALADWRRRRSGSAQTAVRFDLKTHGREDLFDGMDLSQAVGWFTAQYPQRLDPGAIDLDAALDGGGNLGQAIAELKDQMRSVPDNGIGYGLLRYLCTETAAGLSSYPASQLGFNYLGRSSGTPLSVDVEQAEGASMQKLPQPQLHAIELVAACLESGEGPVLQANWSWAPALFKDAELRDLAQGWFRALRGIAHFSASQSAGRLTPSDLPLIALDQAQIDTIQARVPAAREILPLTPLQRGLLFHSLYADSAPDAYDVQMVFELDGSFSRERFEAAICALLRRHDNLLATFLHEGLEQPVQVIATPAGLPLEWHDLSALPPEIAESEARSLLATKRERGFRLDRSPLIRFLLIRTRERQHWLAMANHHIVMDGWSRPLILDELFSLYASGGDDTPLPRVTPYPAYLRWMSHRSGTDATEQWQRHLAGLGEATLVATRRQEAPQAPRTRLIEVGSALTHGLQKRGRTEGLTLNTLVQSAWALVLSSRTGRSDVVFGITVSGRPPELDGAQGMIGMFVNTLPVRVPLQPGQDLTSMMRQLQSSQADLLEYQHGDLAEVQKRCGLGELFDSVIAFQNFPFAEDASAGMHRAGLDIRYRGGHGGDASHYALTLQVFPGPSLGLRIGHRPDLIDAEAAQDLEGRFLRALALLAEGAQGPLCKLELLSLADRQRVLVDWNATSVALPPMSIVQGFVEQARRFPDRIAATCDSRQISYRDLDARSNQVAHYLSGLGVGPGVVVGLCLERSPELLVAMLGILKAGAAYLPLETRFPPERLNLMLNDVMAPVLISQASLVDQLPSYWGQLVEMDTHWPEIGACPSTLPPLDIGGDALAYVMYTSGSTGTPKGIGTSHRNVFDFASDQCWRGAEYQRVLHHSPQAFDASTFEIWVPLLAGNTVVLVAGDAADLQVLRTTLVQQRVTALFLTAALFRLLAEIDPHCFCNVRAVWTGGEAANAAALRKVQLACPGTRLVNVYGPTEVTTFASSHPVPALAGHEIDIPIGRPLDNTQAYVLDAWLRPVTTGVIGELYLGGTGLARGYINQPDLTAVRFVCNPFGRAGERLYRTGDLARWLPDGTLAFAGRVDHQVKIRGFRIEPGEIEACLSRHPAVAEAVVLARESPSGGAQLVAYVVPVPGHRLEALSLRHALAEQLPAHMVPSAIVVMEVLPLTPTGKLDRAALPLPVEAEPRSEAPRTPFESLLATLFAESLGMPAVGLDDSFFDLGGHSLLAIRLVSRIHSVLGIQLPLRALFDAPTVASLARALEGMGSTQAQDLLVTLRSGGSRAPLFCLPPGLGLSWCYLGLLPYIDIEVPVHGLQMPDPAAAPGGGLDFEQHLDLFIEEIRRIQPAGPYRLMGWSLGGLFAQALAAKLEALGEEIALLALLDSYPVPVTDVASGTNQAQEASEADMVRTMLEDFFDLSSVANPQDGVTPQDLIDAHLNTGALTAADARFVARGARTMLLGVKLLRQFQPPSFSGDAAFFRATIRDPAIPRSIDQWRPYLRGDLQVHEIACSHGDMMDPVHQAAIGRVLEGLLAARDHRTPAPAASPVDE